MLRGAGRARAGFTKLKLAPVAGGESWASSKKLERAGLPGAIGSFASGLDEGRTYSASPGVCPLFESRHFHVQGSKAIGLVGGRGAIEIVLSVCSY